MNFLDKKNGQGILSNLDLTPIVDVVFNLLIFFALSLNFAAQTSGIKVQLPKATSAEQVKTKDITINLTSDGKIYYNDEAVNSQSIVEKLKKVENKDILVIIKADNNVKHGTVVETMDIVKSNGFPRLAIAVERKDKE
ncbi:MAG: ExbD/TolR family protein [Thermodesulfobacteriota bacterium]